MVHEPSTGHVTMYLESHQSIHDRRRNTHLYVNMNTYIHIHIADTLHLSTCNSLEKETHLGSTDQPPSAGGFLTWWLCPWHRSEEIRGKFTVGGNGHSLVHPEKTLTQIASPENQKSKQCIIIIIQLLLDNCYMYIYIYDLYVYVHIPCWVSYRFKLRKNAVPTGK